MKKYLFLTFSLLIFLKVYSQNLNAKIDSLISQMSLNEKIEQLSRDGFFNTKTNSKLSIPGFDMSDGPHGYGKKVATCFPQSISAISSWEPELWYQFGKAMGQEFIAQKSNVQLGPCLDLTRDPRNGRTAESIGEDPYLGSIYSENIVKGIQYHPLISTIKHFIGTNKEDNRTTANILLSENNLENIYGKPFKRAIQHGGAYGIMSSYNLINGIYSSENKYLLDTILRKRWGFPFMVMSDWGSIKNSSSSIKAGNDLCMGSYSYKNEIETLINDQKINESDLNFLLKNVLMTKFISGINEIYTDSLDLNYNQKLALKIAQKSIILLKNQDSILPLKKNQKIFIIGPSAKKIQLDGFGSSRVNPPYSISPYEGILKKINKNQINYSFGCPIKDFDTSLFIESRKFAKESDLVVFFGGLDETMEGEGFGIGGDRKNGRIELPEHQLLLINELHKVNPNLIVVLQSGGVCSLGKTEKNIKGLLYSFYPGMEGGNAIADILFGDINPSGKLPVTVPLSTEQLPEWNDDFNDDYGHGYRFFNKSQRKPAFPFGFGLNYSKIDFENINLKNKILNENDTLNISIKLKNKKGPIGEEVVQIYSYHETETVSDLRLISFRKIKVDSASEITNAIDIPISDLSTYFKNNNQIKPGKHFLLFGNNSEKFVFKDSIIIKNIPNQSVELLNFYSYPRYPTINDEVEYYVTIKNNGNLSFLKNEILKIQIVDDENHSHKINYLLDRDFNSGEMLFIPLNSEKLFKYSTIGFKDISITISINQKIFNKVFKNKIVTQSSNLGLNKNIYSNQSSTNLSLINDGKNNTVWKSNYNSYVWITFDLDKCFDIKKIELNWQEGYANKMYVLAGYSTEYLSDTIFKTKNGKPEKLTINTNKTARFLQFVFYGKPEEFDNYSISEISIYGDSIHKCFDLKKTSLFIFPNPTFDYLYFSQPIPSNSICTIFDVYGRKIFEKEINEESINISYFNEGIYNLKIENLGETLVTNKFIKISK